MRSGKSEGVELIVSIAVKVTSRRMHKLCELLEPLAAMATTKSLADVIE